MPAYSIFPTIDEYGDVDEQEIASGADSLVVLEGDKKIYIRREMGLSMRTKRGKTVVACTAVFVSDKWNVQQAEKLIGKNLPWFFSYAVRTTI